MYILENLQKEFNLFINNKKWNRFMEDRCKSTYVRLVELEKKCCKDILDIDNKTIAENSKNISYQVVMQEIYMINQIFDFLSSSKRISLSDFSEDMLKVNTSRFYTKKELINICESLVNAQDKIILYGLFAGLRGTAYKELLQLKVSDINFEEGYIQLEDRKLEIDDYFKGILEDAIDPIYGSVYHKYYDPNAGAKSNCSYELNMDSEFVIKAKPYSKNNNGLNAMTNSGFQTRVEKLSIITKRSLVPIDLVRSGIMSRMNNLEVQWKKNKLDKYWGKDTLVSYLKDNKLKAEPFELLRIYNQKYNVSK